jgi:hypothetical protein
VQLKLGNLVLLRSRKRQDKLSPRWSLPHRVTHVNGDGTVATASSILTGKVRVGVHVKDCRVINPPVSLEQLQEWERLMQLEEVSPSKRRRRAPLSRGESEVPEAARARQQSSPMIFDLTSESDSESDDLRDEE